MKLFILKLIPLSIEQNSTIISTNTDSLSSFGFA